MDTGIAFIDIQGFYVRTHQELQPRSAPCPWVVIKEGQVLEGCRRGQAEGLAPGVPQRQVQCLCPQAELVAFSPDACQALYRQIWDIVAVHSPGVEPIDFHQGFADITKVVSGIHQAKEWRSQVIGQIQCQTDLKPYVGIGPGKFVARVAATHRAVIDGEEAKEFLALVPVADLDWLAPDLRQALPRLGLTTLGQVGDVDRNVLIQQLGIVGGQLHDWISGKDERPVQPLYPPREERAAYTFALEDRTEVVNQVLGELCAQVAGLPRHIGTHLGGLIISGRPLSTLSPLQQAAKGCRIIQFDKVDVEDLRLMKLDLLCLRMLSAVQDTVTSTPRRIDFARIPLDDQPTYKLLNTGETAGAFQLESPAQRNLQSRLQADNLEDIVASVALIRPGPIKGNMVEPFLARRHGKEPITYADPRLEEILKDTYGVVLFQEQVIEIAVKIAGFSPGEADQLRRALTHHREQKEMQTIGQNFVRKATQRGCSQQVAKTIFSYLQGYAGYGFCEAHAAAFGDTGYKTAYLLTHYPAYFYAALLSNQPMGYFPSHTLINEAKRRGIKVLGPSVSESQAQFTVEQSAIRVGLRQIREMPETLGKRIVAQQPYSNLRDFMDCLRPPVKVAENLALCGALDCFEANRRRLIWQLAAYRPAKQAQLPLQQAMPLDHIEDFTASQKCCHEWDILGFSPTWHPLEFVRPQLRKAGVLTAQQIKQQRPPGTVKVAGLLIRPHRPPTRSGRTVLFFTLEDEIGLLEVTVFENIYEHCGKQIFSSSALLIQGCLDRRGTGAIVADRIERLN